MSFRRGHEKLGGRKKGQLNHLTSSAKEAFALAFDKLGSTEGLVSWGKKHPTDFYKLYSKLIPVDITSAGEKLNIGVVYNQVIPTVEK